MKKRETNNAENWSHNNDYPIGEAWNTDNTLAQLIVPRLLAFKALDKHGYPPEFDDVRKWNNTIQNLSVAKPQQLRDSCLCYCKDTNFKANHNELICLELICLSSQFIYLLLCLFGVKFDDGYEFFSCCHKKIPLHDYSCKDILPRIIIKLRFTKHPPNSGRYSLSFWPVPEGYLL